MDTTKKYTDSIKIEVHSVYGAFGADPDFLTLDDLIRRKEIDEAKKRTRDAFEELGMDGLL